MSASQRNENQAAPDQPKHEGGDDQVVQNLV